MPDDILRSLLGVLEAFRAPLTRPSDLRIRARRNRSVVATAAALALAVVVAVAGLATSTLAVRVADAEGARAIHPAVPGQGRGRQCPAGWA